MRKPHELHIEPGFWRQFTIKEGERFQVLCPEGSQVADLWAFKSDDPQEFLSAEHTRSTLQKLTPKVGDALYSNRRHAMLHVMQDTSPGDHDFLMSACDPRRYELLGHDGYHRSCAENLCHAMDEAGITIHELPSPFNIFQKVTVAPSGEIAIVAPQVKAGEFLELRAECDLLIVVSACPMDIAKTNGPDGDIRPILVKAAV